MGAKRGWWGGESACLHQILNDVQRQLAMPGDISHEVTSVGCLLQAQ